MQRIGKICLAGGLAVIALSSFSSAYSQSTRPQRPPAEEPPPDSQSPPSYERTGSDLPKYVVVRKFFRVAASCSEGARGSYLKMLHTLGIEEGSRAEELLLNAIPEALSPEVSRRPDLTPFMDDPPGFQQVQLQALRTRVHHLRRIYYKLLRDLEKEGISKDAFDAFVEQMRVGMVMVSSPNPEYEVFEIMEEFERGGGR